MYDCSHVRGLPQWGALQAYTVPEWGVLGESSLLSFIIMHDLPPHVPLSGLGNADHGLFTQAFTCHCSQNTCVHLLCRPKRSCIYQGLTVWGPRTCSTPTECSQVKELASVVQVLYARLGTKTKLEHLEGSLQRVEKLSW